MNAPRGTDGWILTVQHDLVAPAGRRLLFLPKHRPGPSLPLDSLVRPREPQTGFRLRSTPVSRCCSALPRLIVLGLVLLMVSGCVGIPGQGGTTHYLIVGVGIVSVNESEDAITATQTQALGISLSDRPGLKLGIGYASSTVVTVAPGAEDVRVEVSQRPGGPLVVDTQNATFTQPE